MPVLGTSAQDRAELDRRLAADPRHVVALALCAAWCSTCRGFREACERVAELQPQASVVWVDIEDDAGWVGDLDIEIFPTLAVFEGEALRHFGATLPRADLMERLVIDAATLVPGDAGEEVARLVRALRG